MLINLISTDNYNHYNIELAHIIGLKEAIYVNELLAIYSKANRKGKIRKVSHPADPMNPAIIPDDDYFYVDREYIQERTTLTPAEQESIEHSLVAAKILKKDITNITEVCVNISFLSGVFLASNEMINSQISLEMNNTKDKKTTQKESKQKAVAAALKAHIKETNIEKLNLYSKWVDNVLANPKSGKLTNDAVDIFVKAIEYFTNNNMEAFEGVMNVAIINGWKTPEWSIEQYKKTKGYSSGVTRIPESKTSYTETTTKVGATIF